MNYKISIIVPFFYKERIVGENTPDFDLLSFISTSESKKTNICPLANFAPWFLAFAAPLLFFNFTND